MAVKYVIYSLSGYMFDAFLSVKHKLSTSITSHPVETGANVSDHSYINPKELTLQIAVSDSSVNGEEFEGGGTRSVNAYNILKELQESREPLEVFSKYEDYENMIITNIDVEENSDNSEKLVATVSLQQVITSSLKTVKISIDKQTTDSYNSGSNEVSNLNEQERVSLLKQLYNYLT